MNLIKKINIYERLKKFITKLFKKLLFKLEIERDNTMNIEDFKIMDFITKKVERLVKWLARRKRK